ncbi:MAG: acyltransferase [Candidatus Thioglobus sp.]|nr:acyltransferase [Candidatus Thioglobus sp.]
MPKLYFKHLDSLRFYAVFLVIFAHIFQIWTWQENTVLLFPMGSLGVMIFFVLSGFLITKILLAIDENEPFQVSFKNFYARRSLRIFPIYYLYLLIIFIFNLENIHQAGLMPWAYLTNIYIFNNDTWLNANSHLWTLSIEEQFYIIWPFLILTLKNNYRFLLGLFATIIAISIASRVYLTLENYSISPQIEVFTLANLDSLALGGLFALLYQKNSKRLKTYALPMIAGGILGYYIFAWMKIMFGWQVLFWSVGKFFIVIFAGGLVLFALFSKTNKQNILHNKITIHLGKISYGLYLYHNIIVAHYDKIANFFFIPVGDSIVVKIILSLFFTIGIAQISFVIIEKPLLKLKAKFAS